MKRIYGILAAAMLTMFLVTGCGSDGSKEAKSIIKKQADVTEKYINGLAEVKNADDLVKVFDQYTEDMKELVPELIEFEKKYPEFEDGNVPEGLEEDARRMEELSAKTASAMMKAMPYMMNEKVVAAVERMEKELSALD